MAAWSDGYFTDIQYTGKFFAQMAPGRMTLACLRQGVRPPALGPGSTYLELGCGQGFGLNLIAAANPWANFIGVDFNPGQIANAQRLAAAAGLANVTFEDLSFEQLLAQPAGRIPQCDVIALHGVLSWVSPANRARIVRILDRHLKPGGIAAVSYNVRPGWDSLMPFRRFLKEHFDRARGDPRQRAMEAFHAVQDLIARGVPSLDTPKVKGIVEQALKADAAYLIHEYLNDHFHPLFHADVARELGEARLTFAAAINLSDDMIGLAAPAKLQALVEGEPDSVWRETLLDYSNDRRFRRDVFVRGRNELGAREREAMLRQVRFELMQPATDVKLEFPVPTGVLRADSASYRPVVEALADGPKSYDDLARLPVFAAAGGGVLPKAIGLLVESGAIHPTPPAEVDAGPARRFNQVLLERFSLENTLSPLAAPGVGSGVRMDFVDMLALGDAGQRKPDHAATARRGWEMLSRGGLLLQKNGKTLPDQAANEAELVERLRSFEARKAPLFRRLGII